MHISCVGRTWVSWRHSCQRSPFALPESVSAPLSSLRLQSLWLAEPFSSTHAFRVFSERYLRAVERAVRPTAPPGTNADSGACCAAPGGWAPPGYIGSSRNLHHEDASAIRRCRRDGQSKAAIACGSQPEESQLSADGSFESGEQRTQWDDLRCVNQVRRRCAGSMRDARQAGEPPATAPTVINTTAALASAIGSRGSTP
jgi:hypothetical protein